MTLAVNRSQAFSPPAQSADGPARERFAVALIALACLAVYANSLLNGFAFDDEFIIAGNARVHQLGDQAAIWLTPYWPGFGAEAGLYRPFAIFAYAVQWAIGGDAPGLFHAVNLIVHGLATILLFAVLRSLMSVSGALAGALLFAVHPVHTEAVANAVGQAELIAAAALLGACLVWLRRVTPASHATDRPGDSHTRAPGFLSRVGLSLLFAIALLSKESAIVLPALLVVLDAARGRIASQGGRAYARRIAGPMSVLAVTGALYIVMRAQVLGSFLGGNAAPSLPFLRTGQRFLVALQAWPEYARLMFWPFDLSADYSPDVITPANGFSASVLLGAGLLALVGLFAVRVQRAPRIALPAAWFGIAILPVSNLIAPIGVVLAERLLYTPSIAIAIAAGFGYERAAAAGRAYRGVPLAGAVLLTLLVAFGLRSTLRNPDWADTPAYWNALVRDHPESYRAQWGVGAHMAANGDPVRAREYLKRAVETWPHDPELLNELGLMHLRLDDATEAIAALERALPLGAVAHATRLHLAEAYLAAGRPADALAVIADPDAGPAGTTEAVRAQALDGLGRFHEAAAAWRRSRRAAGERQAWASWALSARTLARSGALEVAAAAADTALRSAPDDAARALVQRVRTAIDHACYSAEPARDACEDPLASWLLLPAAGVLRPVPDVADRMPKGEKPPPQEPPGRGDGGAP